MVNTKIYTIFVLSNIKSYINMQKEITEQENDLIEAIRNYQNSFHNKSKELRRYAQILFDEMIYD